MTFEVQNHGVKFLRSRRIDLHKEVTNFVYICKSKYLENPYIAEMCPGQIRDFWITNIFISGRIEPKGSNNNFRHP